MFAPIFVFGIWLLVSNTSDSNEATVGVMALGIGLFFVVPAVILFWYGKKILRKSTENVLEKWAKDYNYLESDIRAYMNQVLQSDTYILHIAGKSKAKYNVGCGFLTRDFLAIQGVIMKRSDIISARLVKVAEPYSVGNKIKTRYEQYIKFLGRNECFLMSLVNKEAADELKKLLLMKNPDIDMNLEYILSEKEFKKYAEEIIAPLQSCMTIIDDMMKKE